MRFAVGRRCRSAPPLSTARAHILSVFSSSFALQGLKMFLKGCFFISCKNILKPNVHCASQSVVGVASLRHSWLLAPISYIPTKTRVTRWCFVHSIFSFSQKPNHLKSELCRGKMRLRILFWTEEILTEFGLIVCDFYQKYSVKTDDEKRQKLRVSCLYIIFLHMNIILEKIIH